MSTSPAMLILPLLDHVDIVARRAPTWRISLQSSRADRATRTIQQSDDVAKPIPANPICSIAHVEGFGYLGSWTMIEKLRTGILASPGVNSTWTELLPTKSLLGW